MIEVFSTVVGITFRPASAKEAMDSLVIGDRLLFEAEPSNPYDSNAVKVIEPKSGEFIGYLSRESNSEVAEHIADDNPYHCEIASFLSTRKPHVRIELYDREEAAEGNDSEE
jgi:hypothetical protein